MLKIANGDYLPDELGRLQRLQGDEALLQRVLFRLTARKGGLVFLPELGSDLYRLGSTKPGQRRALALQYVTEALKEEPVTVEDVTVSPSSAGLLKVTVLLRKGMQPLRVAVTV